MHPPSLFMPFHHLVTILFFLKLSSLPISFSGSYYDRYENCAPVMYACGKIKFNLSYPFRVDGRDDYCGHPKYYLSCINNNTTLIISINNEEYLVKNVDSLSHLLTVVDLSLISQSCPEPYENTTIDPSLFSYSDRDQIATLYVNCTALTGIPTLYDIGCALRVAGPQHSYYRFDNTTNFVDLWGKCSSTVLVPMSRTAAFRLLSGNLSFGDALKEGFILKWTARIGRCSDCISSGGRCGYNHSSPDDHTCYCPNGPALGSCLFGNRGTHNLKKTRLMIGVITSTAGLSLGCLFLLVYLLHYKKSHSKNAQNVEDLLHKYGSLVPKRYKYSEIKRMTKSFSYKLGQGGYGNVFKGNLYDGHPVAVKVLHESKGNGEEFINELVSIGGTSHVNIVCLLGFCLEGLKRALVYEFMPNGSLEKFIHTKIPDARNKLGWEKLYEIAVGIARGLEYLHRGCNTRMVHFDIKPHNILLDQDFCPKISDFGLAKLCPPKESIISIAGARGTVGYIAPEVFSRNFGVASSKSDVYSYGMMVLEMVGGRKNIYASVENTSEIYFPHWIYDHLDQYDALEACGVTSEMEEIAKKMIIVGLWCIQVLPADRSSISRVVNMLEGSISDLQMPPRP